MTINLSNLNPALQMTDACNKNCKACLRTPGVDPVKISYDNFRGYVRDIKTLSEKYRIRFQFVTGGEPTIWKDDGKDITDVLSELRVLNSINNLTMPTNGKIFENYDFAEEFLTKLSNKLAGKLIIGISIAEYQNNLSDRGSTILDNVLKICKNPEINIMPIALVTLSTEDNTSNLLKEKYPSLYQRVTPLAPIGSASDMHKNCPSLSMDSKNKDTLGSFLPFFKMDILSKLKIGENEFDEMDNSLLMDKLSLYNNCGKSPFISGKWFYCLPLKNYEKFTLAEIGSIKADIIEKIINENPFLKSIRENGVISTVNNSKDKLSKENRDKLEEYFSADTTVPVAYRGCIICKELYDNGILKEISRILD